MMLRMPGLLELLGLAFLLAVLLTMLMLSTLTMVLLIVFSQVLLLLSFGAVAAKGWEGVVR